MKLKEICKAINLELEKELSKKKETEIVNISNLISHAIKKGGLYFDTTNQKISSTNLKLALEKEVIIVSDKEYFTEEGNKVNTIKTDNPKEKYYELAKYHKTKHNIPTIAITGSVGKTTTTSLANLVFAEKYKVLSTGLTSNTPTYFVEEIYSKLNDKKNFYIQETGAMRPKLIEEGAQILNVDAFIITNINKYHHLDKYITSDALIEDKTSFDRYSKENAIGIINADDEILSKYPFKRKIITFGIKNKKADYIATNIKQNNDILEFDIKSKNRKITTIKMNIVGKHNVYNALAVYIAAKQFKITDEQIKEGLSKYKSKGIRQNFETICGRKVYIDTFNVCSDSIKSCLESIETIEIDKKAQKIAIFGGENALGENSYKVNFETGKQFKKYKIDKFICVGIKDVEDKEKVNFFGDGKALYEGAKTVLDSAKISYYNDIVELSKFLAENTKEGDLILIKGIFRLGLFTAVDLAFGTNYTSRNPYFINNAKPVKNDFFEGIQLNDIKKIHLTKYNSKSLDVMIPNEINGMEVISMKEKIFHLQDIESVEIGKNIRFISKQAFKSCKKIKEIIIPGNVKIIGENSFENCKQLRKIVIKEGVLQINQEAFKNCSSLKEVYLPNSIIKISDDAFPKNKKIKIHSSDKKIIEKFKYNTKKETIKKIKKLIKRVKRLIKKVFKIKK